MILITTALFHEAKPVIEYFNLKKDPSSTRFDLYSNEEISLVISGVGVLKSVVATTWIIAHTPQIKAKIAFNIGICGSFSDKYEIGTLVIANKIICPELKKTYYPDMLARHNLVEATVNTFLKPVDKSAQEIAYEGFADMEAAGFMEASLNFLPPHNIYCLKVVSDYLAPESVNQTLVGKLIEQNLPNFEYMFEIAGKLNKSDADVLSPQDYEMLDCISNKLKFTVSLKHQLVKIAKQYKNRKGNLDIMADFCNTPAKSKNEGKIVFEKLKELLLK